MIARESVLKAARERRLHTRSRPVAGILMKPGLAAAGLKANLLEHFDIHFTTSDIREALAVRSRLEVVVVQVELLGRDATWLSRLRIAHSDPVVVGIGSRDDHSLLASAAKAGVRDFIFESDLDPSTTALSALKDSRLGSHTHALVPPKKLPSAPENNRLTDREREILELIACGLDDQSISRTVHLSIHGVKKRIRSILSKLGASNRTQAAVLGVLTGLCEPAFELTGYSTIHPSQRMPGPESGGNWP